MNKLKLINTLEEVNHLLTRLAGDSNREARMQFDAIRYDERSLKKVARILSDVKLLLEEIDDRP